ncbi:MAG: SPFH domain-containing protein [Lachnospiraceae bacterium]|nr:SPFH domain-containing protein [Lachnospiraceae bacterium]
MGLIKAALGAAGGVLADQWKEYFYCEALPADVLVRKGQKKVSGRSSNTKGDENIISNGSVIAVADGQCMIIVEQGKVVDLCAEPGEFTYDTSTEPSLFDGGKLGDNIKAVFGNIGKRFTFGGEAPKDQRVYYFNTKEIIGNKYGTPNPVPFRVVDNNIGLDMDIAIRCFGEYSYKVTNPILFYTNVCGNISNDYSREEIDSQLKTELLTALQPAFARISEMGIRYSALAGHAMEIGDALNQVLSAKWKELRGIEIVSFGVSSLSANEEDEKRIKDYQAAKVFSNPAMGAGLMATATASAMQDAANNTNGAGMGFMGMGMAMNTGGMNMGAMYQQAGMQQQMMQQQGMQPQMQQQAPQQQAPQQVEVPLNSWVCSACGTPNQGKFCKECGAKKPDGVPQYRCDKCGWEPADKTNPPKFCPECGDPFDDGDII